MKKERAPECRICGDSHCYISPDGLCRHCIDDIDKKPDAFKVQKLRGTDQETR